MKYEQEEGVSAFWLTVYEFLPVVSGRTRRVSGWVKLSMLWSGSVVQSPHKVSSKCDPPTRLLTAPYLSAPAPLQPARNVNPSFL